MPTRNVGMFQSFPQFLPVAYKVVDSTIPYPVSCHYEWRRSAVLCNGCGGCYLVLWMDKNVFNENVNGICLFVF
jgi:hypothetical protein